MRRLIVYFALVGGAALAAPDRVCVRDFMNDGGMIPCNSMTKGFAWVVPVEPRPKAVCTRVYEAFYCDQAKEFEWIESEDGKKICVLNNDQPGVANLCEGSPKTFVYVKRRP